MDRLIFCPDESMMPEAIRLSRLHLAPIQLGESERTKHLAFDKASPTPVLVPVFHYVKITPDEPVVGQVHRIDYVNEFINLKNNAYVLMLNHTIGEPNGWFKPDSVDITKHKITFFHKFLVPETFTIQIRNDEKIYDSFTYSIKEEQW